MVNKILGLALLLLVVVLGIWLKNIAVQSTANTSAKATEEAIKHDLKNLNDFTSIFTGDYIGGVLTEPEETCSDQNAEYDYSSPTTSGKESCDPSYSPDMGEFEHPSETESYEADAEQTFEEPMYIE